MTFTEEKKKKQRPSKKLTLDQIRDKRQRKHMTEKAAILSICQLGDPDDRTYQVWGGTQPHVVRVMPNGQILCDCEGWKNARNHNCSHAHKYRLTYGDLKK